MSHLESSGWSDHRESGADRSAPDDTMGDGYHGARHWPAAPDPYGQPPAPPDERSGAGPRRGRHSHQEPAADRGWPTGTGGEYAPGIGWAGHQVGEGWPGHDPAAAWPASGAPDPAWGQPDPAWSGAEPAEDRPGWGPDGRGAGEHPFPGP